MTDFQAAKRVAEDRDKDLLVDFTGSDWCGWCIRLNKEVFSHDAFVRGVSDHFILVELNYPRDKSDQPKDLQIQNAALRELYQIEAFPTILLLDQQGRPYAKTSYQAGGPESYLKHLEELRLTRSERDRALAAASNLHGIDRARALASILQKLPPDQLQHYRELTEEIARLDPQDESGFLVGRNTIAARKKLDADIVAVLRGEMEGSTSDLIDNFLKEHKVQDPIRTELLVTRLELNVRERIREGHPDQAAGMVDEFIQAHKLDKPTKQKVLVSKVGACIQAQRMEDALSTLDAIIALAPDSAEASHAREFRAEVENMRRGSSDPSLRTHAP